MKQIDKSRINEILYIVDVVMPESQKEKCELDAIKVMVFHLLGEGYNSSADKFFND